MRKIKTAAALLLVFCMCFALSACGSSADHTRAENADNTTIESTQTQADTEESAETTVQSTTETTTETEESTQPKQEETESETDVLVVVFSATGTTKGVAEKIAAIENADLYEIVAAEPYSDEDLNYNDNNSRTSKEQNDASVRPGIASESIDITKYSKIYIGYPIWWGQEPRIMDTFVESYDFGDIIMIPFCTSGSSGIGKSGSTLADLSGNGNWIEGKRFDGGVSEDALREWINGL